MTSVAVLVPDAVIGFEAMIPGQVFGMANLAAQFSDDEPPFEVRVCTPDMPVATLPAWGATEISSPYRWRDAIGADVVIVPGAHNFLDHHDDELLTVLRTIAEQHSRIAAVCVGAFILAAAGLLDGQRATTHWQWADDLASRYPCIDVDPTVLFVDAGRVLTSAGVTAGIDLCLHLIRSHRGAGLAAMTARRLVLPAWRDGGQAQYIEHADPAESGHALQSTIDWVEQNLTAELDLAAIASHASMSVRTLNRQFRLQVGTTPQALLTRMRVDRTRTLLESTYLPMDRIAAEAGFGSVESMRVHFGRNVGIPPHKYRANYLQRTPTTRKAH